MGSWEEWSSWQKNDNWTDWDWRSSKSSEEHRWTGWDEWNGQGGWTDHSWQDPRPWGWDWNQNAGEQEDWSWNQNAGQQEDWNWKGRSDDFEDVVVDEIPKPTAAKTRPTPKPQMKAKANGLAPTISKAKAKLLPKTKLMPKPPRTVPPPHLVAPPVRPSKIALMDNPEAPLALREPADTESTSLSPKRKLESASHEILAKEQKTGQSTLCEQKENASGSSGPELPRYNMGLAQAAASPKSLGGWKPPTAAESYPPTNAEVLAAHAASLALAAGGLFIPSRFLNSET